MHLDKVCFVYVLTLGVPRVDERFNFERFKAKILAKNGCDLCATNDLLQSQKRRENVLFS